MLAFRCPSANCHEKGRIAVILIADNLSVVELEAFEDRDYLERNFDGAIVSYRSGAPINQHDLPSIFSSLNSGDRVYLRANLAAGIGNTKEMHENFNMDIRSVYISLLGKEPETDIVFTGINAARSYLEAQNSEKIGRLGNFLKRRGLQDLLSETETNCLKKGQSLCSVVMRWQRKHRQRKHKLRHP